MHALAQGSVYGVPVAEAPVYVVAPQALQAPAPQGGVRPLGAPLPTSAPAALASLSHESLIYYD